MSNVYEAIGALSRSTKRDPLDVEGHVCGLFRDPDEEYGVVLPFVKKGLSKGERAYHIVDPSRKEEHIQRMTQAGINVDGAVSSGQLLIDEWSDLYLRGGSFDQDRVMSALSDVSTSSLSSGYPRTRFYGQMEWATNYDPDDLIEYEANFEKYAAECGALPTLDDAGVGLSRYAVASASSPARDTGICSYQLANWGGDLILRTLRTHPLVIIGGVLHDNPFYLNPDQILTDLRQRKALHSGCC